MSVGREYEFTIGKNDDDKWTYTRKRLPYKQINVLKLPIEEYLFEETSDELDAINSRPENYQVPFNTEDLRKMDVAMTPEENFKVTFTASGTAVIEQTAYGEVTLSRDNEMSYTIKIYKGGQITFQ